MTSTQGLYAWHVHHDVLVERLTEPIESRIAYIKAHKPVKEQALRLRLLQVVKDQKAVVEADKAYRKALAEAGRAYKKAMAEARKAYDQAVAEASKAYDQATAEPRKAYDQALAEAGKAMAELHAKECPDCPWNGKTIFP